MLPSFETQRLIVRPRGIGDLNACLAMDRDPAVLRYIDVPWRSVEEHRQFVVNRITRAYPVGLGYWSVVLKLVPAAFVGWVLLMPYDAIGPEIEIGWRLLRSAWGNGFATEASLPVLRNTRSRPRRRRHPSGQCRLAAGGGEARPAFRRRAQDQGQDAEILRARAAGISRDVIPAERGARELESMNTVVPVFEPVAMDPGSRSPGTSPGSLGRDDNDDAFRARAR